MPATTTESFAASGPSKDAPPVERRRRARSSVQWRVSLFRRHFAEPVEAKTDNLSSEGFYCSTDKTFTPGERLLALLHVPSHNPSAYESTCKLKCDAQVVRVDAGNGAFGVACRIEDYTLVPTDS